MLNHISLGTADLARARRFYDAALKPLGLTCTSPGETSLGYGNAETGAIPLWLLAVKKPVKADAQNGLHLCFDAPSRRAVDAFHAAALKAGGSDNGKPGLRADYGENYYAAFVVDPDGYRMESYFGAAK
ncbi:VOC family protein [Ferrovibrio sp.]|uniref:VOC family protein n=1 Tax=Ferrovibrio sp. TaxID=1917215 RepID=UPI0031203A50